MNNNIEIKERERKILKERNCGMCGIILPAIIRYDSNWCWMCWRRTWEAEYPRYYIRRKSQKEESQRITYWEEVNTLRGINGFSESNQPLIKEKMTAARAELNKETNNDF